MLTTIKIVEALVVLGAVGFSGMAVCVIYGDHKYLKLLGSVVVVSVFMMLATYWIMV